MFLGGEDMVGIASTIATANAQYLTGAYTRLWHGWSTKNAMQHYNKLYYIKKGTFYFEVNGKKFTVGEGALVLLPAGSVQSYHANNDETATKYWFHFTTPCGDKDLFEQISVAYYIDVPKCDDSKISSLFATIIEKGESADISGQLLSKSAMFELLSYYIGLGEARFSTKLHSPNFLKLTEYIDDNLDRKLSIEELADVVHLSPNYFIRHFHKNFGISPMKYITEQRIKLACHLLIDKGYTIKDVALKTGFSTVYYFDRTFKKHTGYTPSQYRKIATD